MNAVQRTLAFASVALLSLAPTYADTSPTLRVPVLSEAPEIDGRLNDAAWKEAATATGFKASTGTMPAANTEVRIGRHGTALYLAFLCHEPAMARLSAKATHYSDIWANNDDCVAVFLKPDESVDVYYQFVVTPAGTRMTQQCERGVRFYRERPWDVAIGRQDKAWVAEMAVPFHTVGLTEQMGRRWRVNFCRCRHQGPELSDWMGVGRNWHAAAKFGALEGLMVGGGRPEGSPVRIKGVTLPPAKPIQDLSLAAQLENLAAVPIEITATLFVTSPANCTNSFPTSLTLAAATTTDATLTFRMQPERGDHVLWFVLSDRAGRRPLLTSPRVSIPVTAMVTAFPDRSYYTTETDARVLVDLPEYGSTVDVEIAGGKAPSLRRKIPAAPGRTAVAFPLADIPLGAHTVQVSLLDDDGTPCGRASTALTKLAPLAKGREVKIDHERLVMLVDGKPFFPYGFCTLYDDAENLALMKAMGANTVFMGWNHQAKTRNSGVVRAALDRAEKLGMLAYEYAPHGLVQHRYSHPEFRSLFWARMQDEYPALVRSTMRHPGFLSWMFMDEPNLAPSNTKDKQGVLRELLAQYRMAHKVDPYHPVSLNFCRTITDSSDWAATFDIGMIDPYWAPLRRGDEVTYVAAATRTAAQTARRYRKVLNVILNSEMVSSSARPLLPAEQRVQVYAALISGARGLFHYLYPVRYTATRDTLQTLARELHVLAPALLEPEPAHKIVSDSPETHELIATLRQANGKHWLICANLSPVKTLDVAFTVAGLPASASAPVLFENRELPAAGLQDSFAPYATHVYELAGLRAPRTRPVVINIAGRARGASKSKAFVPIPDETNLLANARIENGLEGWRYTAWGKAESQALQKGWLDRETAHSGGASLHLKRGNRESATHFVSAPFLLEAHMRYRFGGWLKSVVQEGEKGPTLQILYASAGKTHANPAYRIQTVGQTMMNISGRSDWREYSRELATGDLRGDEKFYLYCSFYHSVGDAWFDDLYVVEEGKAATRTNLVANSGIEKLAMPQCPEWWTAPYYRPSAGEPMLGAANAPFAVDDAVQYEGRRSLRLTGPYETDDEDRNRMSAEHRDTICVDPGQTYTLSVFLKADREGVPARLFILHPRWKSPTLWCDVSVGTTWRRYTLTKKLAADQGVARVRIDLLKRGVLWLDAVQLEKGDRATAYQARD